MSITFHCPNGHLLKVKDKYGGQTGLCPHCQARVLVPKAPEPLSDDAIADLLGSRLLTTGRCIKSRLRAIWRAVRVQA